MTAAHTQSEFFINHQLRIRSPLEERTCASGCRFYKHQDALTPSCVLESVIASKPSPGTTSPRWEETACPWLATPDTPLLAGHLEAGQPAARRAVFTQQLLEAQLPQHLLSDTSRRL